MSVTFCCLALQIKCDHANSSKTCKICNLYLHFSSFNTILVFVVASNSSTFNARNSFNLVFSFYTSTSDLWPNNLKIIQRKYKLANKISIFICLKHFENFTSISWNIITIGTHRVLLYLTSVKDALYGLLAERPITNTWPLATIMYKSCVCKGLCCTWVTLI